MKCFNKYVQHRDEYIALGKCPSTTAKIRKNFGSRITKEWAKASGGKKAGAFAEMCVKDAINSVGLTYEKADRVIIGESTRTTVKQFFQPDGRIPEMNICLESKMYTFGSSGTANEKLWAFFTKLEFYNEPCLLILAGEHELRKFDECSRIWEVYHNNPDFEDATFAPTIRGFRDRGKLILTTLGDLPDFLKKRTKNDLPNTYPP